MAATQIITLPALIQTSSSVDLSTHAIQSWDVSDSQFVSIALSGTSTAPGPRVEVAYTSESTAAFFALAYPNSTAMSIVITSSISAVMFPVAFKQLRVTTTAIHTGTTTHLANKTVIV